MIMKKYEDDVDDLVLLWRRWWIYSAAIKKNF
jgi:hypothetical protein